VPVPAIVSDIAAGRPVAAVWVDAYGVAADVERIAYYRRAWDEEDLSAG
jgi:hypothetical protein